MPTTAYLDAAVPDISPAIDGIWNTQVAGFARGTLTLDKADLDGYVSQGSGAITGVSGDDWAVRQYISPPLTAGIVFTTADTLAAYLRAQESGAGMNASAQVVLKVVTADGSTVQATLKAGHNLGAPGSAAEFATSLTNRRFPRNGDTTTLQNYTAVTGDRLVLEIGFRKHSTTSTTATIEFGGTSGGTDLPQDETNTTQGVPVVVFSNTITFAAAGGDVTTVLDRGSAAATGRNVTAAETATLGRGEGTGQGRNATASVTAGVGRGQATAQGRAVTAQSSSTSVIGRGQATAQGRNVTAAVAATTARGQATGSGRDVTASESTSLARGQGTATGRNVTAAETVPLGRGSAVAAGKSIFTIGDSGSVLARGSGTATGRAVTPAILSPTSRGQATGDARAVIAREVVTLARGQGAGAGRVIIAAVSTATVRGQATGAGRAVLVSELVPLMRGAATAAGRNVQAAGAAPVGLIDGEGGLTSVLYFDSNVTGVLEGGGAAIITE